MHYNDQGADFKYLIVNERDKRFGLSVTTVGFQAIRAGSVYPPRNHPDAYYFTAQKGRVLHEYQLVYITKGRGTFASDTTPSVDISKGQILFLFPVPVHLLLTYMEASEDVLHESCSRFFRNGYLQYLKYHFS